MLDQIVDVVLKTLYAKNSGLYHHALMTGPAGGKSCIPGFCSRRSSRWWNGSFPGERERKVLHAVRVVPGPVEGKHARPVLSVRAAGRRE
ncbi:hypothetical protein B5V00_13745 [Geothermobacter hydrogeniphilus]|uniref:Uncharacterized protein n=1 Tax=Geothermobacter hydrogeniphilus TaxID=1969733 RepID=A0A1X0XXJ7_9BACT|nr:hypothetical protein B5V00_13745 [Geothermobacter hydrogeniphilus]